MNTSCKNHKTINMQKTVLRGYKNNYVVIRDEFLPVYYELSNGR